MSGPSSIEWDEWHEKSAAARLGIPLDEYIVRRAFGQKWCTRCKDWHDISFFGVDRSRGDGRKPFCCGNRIIWPSPEEQRLKRNATYRRYYATASGAAIKARIYARRRNTERISPDIRERLMDAFDGQCAYCDRPASTIDHVIPVKKGGLAYRGNLLPACISCNSRKKLQPLEEFLKIAPRPKLDLIINELVMEYVL